MTSDLGRTDVKIGKYYSSSNYNLMDSVRAFKDSLDLKTIRHRELKLPWDKYNSVENLDVYSITKPSKGYLFANLDHIRKNVLIDHNLIDSTYAYLYWDKKNGLYCKVVLDEAQFENEYEECVRLTTAVTQLAKHYDKAMIERKMNMTYEKYAELKNKINRHRGTLTIDSWSACEYGPTIATIEIPVSELESLIGTEPNKKPEAKANGIPKVQDVQFLNNRVTIVKFEDGTQTKSVCGKNDTFSEEVGIVYCLFKRYLGDKGTAKFNGLLRGVYESLDQKKELAKQQKELEERIQRKKAKREAAKKRKLAKARQEQVDIIADAIAKSHMVTPDERAEDNKGL